MKVTQEKLPSSQIGLQIEVTPEMSQAVYERVVKEFSRSASIPGFRKGKVPRQVLIQRIGATRIKAAAVEELVEDGLKQAVKQENINALGNYQLRSSFEELVSQFEPGQALSFSASVDVPPDVAIEQYTGLKIQAEEVKPNLEQIDTLLHNYQDQLATLIPVEGRTAQLKDVAVVDFKGMLPSEDPDGEAEPVPGGEAENFQVELAEDQFIPGFIDGIVGMTPGETKEVEAHFPETYPQPTVAGRKAIFTITLKELKEKELPELDDEFAKEVSDFETLAELRQSMEERFTKEASDKTRANQEEALLNALLEQVTADIPETLIDREITSMVQQTAIQLQNQGIDVRKLFSQELVARLREQSRPEAMTRIKRTLALGEIAKREAIEASDEEITAKVNEWLEQLGENAQGLDPDRLRSVVTEDVLKEKIMDWLIAQSEVELVPEGTLTPAGEVDEDADEADEIVEGDFADAGTPAPEVSAAEAVVDAVATPVKEPEDSAPDTSAESAAEDETAPKKKRSPKGKTSKEDKASEADSAATSEDTSAAASKPRKASKKKGADS